MIENMIQRKVPKRKNDLSFLRFMPVVFVLLLFGTVFIFESIGVQSEYLFIGFFLIFIPLAIGISIVETKAWRDSWREFADGSGFTYEEYKQSFSKWARVKGVYRGYSFIVEKFVRGSGKYQKSYTSLKVVLSDKPEGALEISARSFFSGLKKVFNGSRKKLQYIELGDVELDGKLLVKSTSEQFARRKLSSQGIRQGILDIRSQTSSMNLKIMDGEVYYHELSVIVDNEYLLAVLNVLVELAESMKRYG